MLSTQYPPDHDTTPPLIPTSNPLLTPKQSIRWRRYTAVVTVSTTLTGAKVIAGQEKRLVWAANDGWTRKPPAKQRCGHDFAEAETADESKTLPSRRQIINDRGQCHDVCFACSRSS
jgi:hypothetical protein